MRSKASKKAKLKELPTKTKRTAQETEDIAKQAKGVKLSIEYVVERVRERERVEESQKE